MTLAKAIKRATIEGKKIRESAGFKDGVNEDYLESEGIETGNLPCYYYSRSDTNRKDGSTILALWSIIQITADGKADNHVAGRYIELMVSIYTDQDRTAGIVQEVLEKMETSAESFGYEAELNTADSFDLVRRQTIITYRLKKTVME